MRKNALRGFLAAAAFLLSAAGARAVPVFNKESATVLASAAPQAFTYSAPAAAFTYPIRMYFIRRTPGTAVGSATSADGVSWALDATAGQLSTTTTPSVLASSITGCGVLPITGGFRMIYSILSQTGNYRIHSATSADGLAWANDAGVRIDNGTTPLSSPKLVQLKDLSWRLYYLSGFPSQVLTSRSLDSGLTWSAPTVAVSTQAFEIGAGVLTDGRVRVFYTEPLPGVSSGAVVLSALSADSSGSVFNLEAGVRLSTSLASGSLGFPVPVRSTDSFRWRLYYDFANPGTLTTASVHSALTGPPTPTSLTPAAVLNVSTRIITIGGEIFSPAPAVTLTQGGLTLTPASVTRVNDQTINATFDFTGAVPGRWDLKVTNADGTATTLANSFFIDFLGGTTTLVNNLLRPRNGGVTSIGITTFNDGNVLARLYSLDGRAIRTLFDGLRAKGTLNLTWDGRDSTGAQVASGVYVLRAVGPNLNVKDKIVVIR